MRVHAISVTLLGAMLAACGGGPSARKAEPAKQEPEYFQADARTAGTVRGKVFFNGKRPLRKRLQVDEDPVCGKLHPAGLLEETILVNTDGTLANAFVYVKKGLEGKRFAPPPATETVTIDQKGCRFEPRVFGVRTGQTIRIVNSDPVTHNIHPQPKNNRDWNQSQPEGAPALQRRFGYPEVMIRVKCNVHSWMRAYIGVMEHPYFAVTGRDGAFTLPNLPPGEYTIEAWQERMAPLEQQITVKPSAESEVSFTFAGV